MLLASAVDAEEAALALRLRIGIVDIKDPSRGTLGACRPEIWRAVAALRDGIGPRIILSAAAGELRSPRAVREAAARVAIAAALGIDFVKVGLAAIADTDDATSALASVVAAARTGTRVIAVSYADSSGVALPLRDLPRLAALAGAAGCLVDTASKDGRSLLDHLRPGEAARFVSDCRSDGLIAALAGSLSVVHLPDLVALRPDVLGARGALCRGGREGRLDRGRLILFHDALRVARRAIPSVWLPGSPRPAQRAGPTPGRPWPPGGR